MDDHQGRAEDTKYKWQNQMTDNVHLRCDLLEYMKYSSSAPTELLN